MAHLQDSDLSAWDNQSSALLNELIQDMSWVITQSRGGNPCSPSSPSHCSVTRTRSSIDSPNMVTSLSQDCYSRSLLSRPLWKRNIQGWEFIIDGYLNSLHHGTRRGETNKRQYLKDVTASEDDGQKSPQLPVQFFSRELAIAIEEYNHIILKPCCLIKGTPYLHFVSSRVDSSQLEEHFLGLILLQGSLKHLQQGLLCTVQIFQVHQPHPNIHLFLFFPEKKNNENKRQLKQLSKF